MQEFTCDWPPIITSGHNSWLDCPICLVCSIFIMLMQYFQNLSERKKTLGWQKICLFWMIMKTWSTIEACVLFWMQHWLGHWWHVKRPIQRTIHWCAMKGDWPLLNCFEPHENPPLSLKQNIHSGWKGPFFWQLWWIACDPNSYCVTRFDYKTWSMNEMNGRDSRGGRGWVRQWDQTIMFCLQFLIWLQPHLPTSDRTFQTTTGSSLTKGNFWASLVRTDHSSFWVEQLQESPLGALIPKV